MSRSWNKSKNHATQRDLVTFPRGSYGARGVVLLGEDRKENTEMGLVVMETDLERLHLP